MAAEEAADRLTAPLVDAVKENGFSQFSSSVRAVVRIRQKYQAMKKRRMELLSGSSPVLASPSRPPLIFNFDNLEDPVNRPFAKTRRKKKKSTRVLFPSSSVRPVPTTERSRAKNCLYLLFLIVFLQIYNAIENLDDHVLTYDLEGLEKSLKREVFGQQEVTKDLVGHLRDYLSTYVHNKPLVLSLHGPTGVGKSHVGRLLAQHFRSLVGEQLVMQYFVLHHCPTDDDLPQCTKALDANVLEMVTRAQEEEKIPVFIFDEVEHMPTALLDTLQNLVRTRNSNEYLNAIYILISSLGHQDITKFILHNSSACDPGRHSLGQELIPWFRDVLQQHHSLFREAELLPFTLLEKSHVMECFLDEMSREGFYPDRSHVERLAEELAYYTVGTWEYSRSGCRPVVSKVNLL